MYLHLGADCTVSQKDIIGIFDLDTASVSKATRSYLAAAEKKGWVTAVSDELPKAFVVLKTKDAFRVYLSQISSRTLKERTLLTEGRVNR